MQCTKKHISRRNLIKGLGAAGILSTTQTEQLLAQTSIAPVRVLLVALQHGWGISGTSNRSMSGSEYEFAFPDGLDPFNSIKDKCVVIDGLLTLGLWGNNHDLSYADIFTAGVPQGEKGSSFDSHMPLSATPSLDYLLQEQSGKPTLRFSAGYRSWGVQHHPISFDTRGSILPFYTSAFDAYSSVFKDLAATSAAIEVNQGETQLESKIFNFIKNPNAKQLDALSGSEKEKLSRYLSAVSNTENQNKPVTGYNGGGSLDSIPVKGQGASADLPNFLDMVRLGFASNLTTSAVLGIGDIHGIDKFHHDHAHGNTSTWWNTRRDFSQHIVNFVNALAATVDFDGNSLLDNTVIVLTGEVGDGAHDVINKGHIVIGGGGGKIETGRYLKQEVVQGAGNIQGLMREDVNGNLQKQISFGNQHAQQAGSRTNADLLREVGNIAGLNLSQFGLPSQNKGTVL